MRWRNRLPLELNYAELRRQLPYQWIIPLKQMAWNPLGLYKYHDGNRVTQEDKQRFIEFLHARIDREWEARKAVSQARRTLRRPDIYAYVDRLGINSSLIRSHYELPIAMVASSREKTRQGITIRKNKQPMSIVESSSSHLNRAESSYSSNVRSASNMIPWFPANNNTDAHHCDIVMSRSSPSHFTKDTRPSQNQVNYKKIKPLLGKSKRILFEK